MDNERYKEAINLLVKWRQYRSESMEAGDYCRIAISHERYTAGVEMISLLSGKSHGEINRDVTTATPGF